MSQVVLHYPVTRQALAKIYKISRQTFAVWLEDVGITHNHTLTPGDLRKIIRHYDLPEDVVVKV